MNPSLWSILLWFQANNPPQLSTAFWSLMLAIGIQTFTLAMFLGRLFQRVDGLSATAVSQGHRIDDLEDGQSDIKVAGTQLATIVAVKLNNPHQHPQMEEVIERFKSVRARRHRSPEAT
ncbi:MAG: hypothetical protein WBA09_22420 [Candidatus Acidiferrum sp.]